MRICTGSEYFFDHVLLLGSTPETLFAFTKELIEWLDLAKPLGKQVQLKEIVDLLDAGYLIAL